MIYLNDVLINWNKKDNLTQEEAKVRDEINTIRSKYFSDKSHKRVRLLYPLGEPRPDEEDGFNIMKLFPIPLNSSDGQWRWSATIMRKDTKGRLGYTDHHRFVKHQDFIYESDIEFLWFLLNRSSILNQNIFIEDLEKDAEEEVKEVATRAYVEFMLMDKHSPISGNHEMIRDIATIFNMKDVDKMGINQLKIKLRDELIRGEEEGDKFTNFDKFEELVNGDAIREAAFTARQAIVDRVVGYNKNAWWLMSGTNYEEKLMTISARDAAYKEQLFVDEIVNNPNTRDRLYSALGKSSSDITLEKLREQDRGVLQKMYRDRTGEFLNSKKEEIIQKLCVEYGIEYSV